MAARDSRGQVLVVEDDQAMRHFFENWLEEAGYDVASFDSGESCLPALEESCPDVMLLDLTLPGQSGLEVLESARQRHPKLPVLISTADSSVESIVSAMQLGAWDYLVKPIDKTKLLTTLKNAVERHHMELRLEELERDSSGFPGIVGTSSQMKAVFQRIGRVSKSDVTVLIHGESGTGKELVARAIHESSDRASGPFVALNCAAIPETLQEDELFGHEKGAFTGATSQRPGKFELANRGTLFLDEIGELSLSLQAKLLRVIQERSFHRVGGTSEIQSNFRLLAATHRDLHARVAEQQFREDLFFRVAVFELELPPLRERREDIAVLARRFLREFDESEQLELTSEAIEALSAHDWPGNVRELQNAIQRAAIEATDGQLRASDLPDRIIAEKPKVTPVDEILGAPDEPIVPLEVIERRAIEVALRQVGGNLSRAGRQLGIGRTTLYRKLKKYGIQ